MIGRSVVFAAVRELQSPVRIYRNNLSRVAQSLAVYERRGEFDAQADDRLERAEACLKQAGYEIYDDNEYPF